MTKFKMVAVALFVFVACAGLFAQQEVGTARKPGGADPSKRQGPPSVDPASRALTEARVATASEIYNGEMARLVEQTSGLPSDDLPMWSRRWMEDQIKLDSGPVATLAAIQAHLERMKRLEGLLDGYAQTGQGRFTSPLRAKYHRLEAEQMLAEFRTAHPDIPMPTPKATIENRGTTLPPSPPR
jgi:hypothetical protein